MSRTIFLPAALAVLVTPAVAQLIPLSHTSNIATAAMADGNTATAHRAGTGGLVTATAAKDGRHGRSTAAMNAGATSSRLTVAADYRLAATVNGARPAGRGQGLARFAFDVRGTIDLRTEWLMQSFLRGGTSTAQGGTRIGLSRVANGRVTNLWSTSSPLTGTVSDGTTTRLGPGRYFVWIEMDTALHGNLAGGATARYTNSSTLTVSWSAVGRSQNP